MTNTEAIEILNTYDLTDDNEDEEFKEALGMAIKALEKQTKPYERFEPCLCGCNRRDKWVGFGGGEEFVRYVCMKCGLSVDGKNGADAKRKWNEYMRCGR